MDKILQQQLSILKSKFRFEQTEDGAILFVHDGQNSPQSTKKVVFEDYFITGFPGFNFHDKYNNGVAPPSRVMYGDIIKETEKMYQVRVHTSSSDKSWTGWVPKKSCTITDFV